MTFKKIILAAALLIVGAGSLRAAELTDGQKKLYEAAKKEGTVTWYTSQSDSEYAQKMASLFDKLFPGVEAKVVRTTGQVEFQRISQELKSNAVQADVYSTFDETHLVAMKGDGNLADYTPENLAKLQPQLQNLGSAGLWYPTSLSPVSIGYNTNLVTAADAPKSWTDLLDPKWKDQVAIGHPGFSGTAGLWVIAMDKLYGWDYFTKLAKNNPQIGRSVIDSYNLILSGERKVAMVPTATTIDGEVQGNPVATIYPTDGTLVLPGMTGIMKAAPHPNAARLFVEFMLSVDMSNMLSADNRQPLRVEATPPKVGKALDQIKIMAIPVDEAMGKIEEVKEKFRDTFGI